MTFCGESVPAAAAVALRAKHETRRKVVLAADEGREEALSLSRHDHTGRIRGVGRPVAREEEAGVRPSRTVVKDVAEVRVPPALGQVAVSQKQRESSAGTGELHMPKGEARKLHREEATLARATSE